MSIRRRPFALAVVFVVTLASGCASTTSSPTMTVQPTGVVTGVASPCEGPSMPQTQYEAISVRVRLLKNDRVVATQVVTGSHTYRFATSPGNYAVSSNQSGTTPSPVTITQGARTVVNLYSSCS